MLDYAQSRPDRELPRCVIDYREIARGFGPVAVQGAEFLA